VREDSGSKWFLDVGMHCVKMSVFFKGVDSGLRRFLAVGVFCEKYLQVASDSHLIQHA
jgi:hypothetical protein